MPLEKPTTPTLDPNHGFAASIVGAWLFVEKTGFTIYDYSGRGNHLYRTNGTGGGWTLTGTNAPYIHLSAHAAFSTGAASADFNHTTGQPWTMIWWIQRNLVGAGTVSRLAMRSNNLVDVGLWSSQSHRPSFYYGAWSAGGGSCESGVDTMFALTYDGTTLRLYKGSSLVPSGVTLVTTVAVAVTPNQQLRWFGDTAGSEYFKGNVYAAFYHRRALSQAELVSHYSAPMEAFGTLSSPGGGDGGGSTSVPTDLFYRGLVEGGYYEHSGDAHAFDLLNWIEEYI